MNPSIDDTQSRLSEPVDDLQHLAESCCDGDGSSFVDAVGLADSHLRRLLGRLTGQSADLEDLLQETYLRAWKGIRLFRRESSMTTWLTRIAVNVARNWMRQRRPQVELVLEPTSSQQHLPEAAILSAYHDALNLLSDNLRTTLVLHESQGMTYQEIADTLSCPIGTVMSRLHRARAQVLEALSERMGELVP